MICNRPTDPPEDASPSWLGAPCPDCGHTTLLHPGPANPGLAYCLTCDHLDAIAELRTTADAAGVRLGKLDTWKAKAITQLDGIKARLDALEATP